MYQVEIRHNDLNKYRVIKGSDPHVVEQKAKVQLIEWDEMWEKKEAKLAQQEAREQAALEKEQKKTLAAQRTEEAEQQLASLENTLRYTLDIDDRIDWEKLKDKSQFPKDMPSLPKFTTIPREPQQMDERYVPKLSLIDKMIGPFKQKKMEYAERLFKQDHATWLADKKRITNKNDELQSAYEEQVRGWEAEKEKFLTQQKENNDAIEIQMTSYLKGDPGAVAEYCDMVLSNSDYPDFFPQEFDIDYNPNTKMLLVDYFLPAQRDIPSIKEVKYIQSRDEFKESFLSAAAFNKLYDDLLYQMTLRTIHELYEADTINAIESVVFNGWVNSVDKATGNEVNACILSIQTLKEEFLNINLSMVEPKSCFKSLKGIGSSKLHSLSPVAPLLRMDREDSRFVSSYAVVDSLDETDNLAAMDWQDFEHLIRELFEKEFNQSGGEVKITRASKDGGVDAIAFDPDPIRGGKIVIQAKRYTNVVGVSAVRDLYGTVLNEGATKGILVSTADYGPDAYSFQKGKPLTLLNGNNLLHLLEKHGHKAKIDLKEAKKILAEK